MESDSDLIRQVAQGEESALEELYRRYGGKVYALLLRMLGGREEAEEVLQDSFVQLYKEARRYDPQRGSVSTFVFTIARNLALSRLRARRVRPQKALEHDLHDPEQEMGLWHEHDPTDRVLVERALARLSPEDRRLLEESFYWGYSHSELSERHQMPLGTVKTKLRRALLQLREFLEGKVREGGE
ncbi:RNA polymerase sigma factor [Calidithermus roseus]|uniref:ECF RNA polymerase sigma factor RpoE n=1 Tax=Calidithermus roseus TaxID=1644118 RepID=A0A399F1U2_9DEIN|nr:sigma-70 family RNA polymerase sigma factor [Calidithermus roseus]RIH88802.1 ECF RNA polymerase sigma factor RpoE [Calidithermus roseus]